MAIKSGYTQEDLARLGPDALTRKRLLAEALLSDATKQRKIEHPLQGLAQMADALVGGLKVRKIDRAEEAGRSSGASAWDKLISGSTSAPGSMGGSMPSVSASGDVAAAPTNMDGNQLYSDFIGTVQKNGVGNPYALAAIAATGKAESGFSPGNANRTWSDPSQSGAPGTAGGIMSWRGPRLNALAQYASTKGEKLGNISPQTQAEFFLREDPKLIAKLNSAKSVEEAQALMNNAWAFAGYDKPGGESSRRLGYAKGFLPSFQSGGPTASAAPNQVASLDPSIGMPGAAGEIQSSSPQPYRDPMVTTAYANPAPTQAAPSLPPPINVASAPTPPNAGVPSPNAQMAPQIPEEFQGSAQLMNADPNRGIMPTLLGGRPASQEQVAQALISGNSAPAPRGPSMQDIAAVLTNDWATPEQKRYAQMELERQQQENDPLRQLQIQKAQRDLQAPQGYRVLSGDERKQLGIPDTDQRVYQVGPDNQINAVGGVGQTINIGNEVDQRRLAAEQAGLKPSDPGYQGFILTGKLPKESEQPLTATDKKAILEADEMVQNTQNVIPLLDKALELNEKAYSGPTAGIRSTVMGMTGEEGALATQDLDTLVTQTALQQLRAIFGGAPTEGERQILLDISGSSSKPAQVRKAIYERAKELASARLKFYQDRANDIRGGTYYKPDGQNAPVPSTQPGQSGTPAPQGQPSPPPSEEDQLRDMPAPDGMEADVWKYVPAEDRRLWLKK